MRVLFASPCKPFPVEEGLDPLDPFTGQLSPAQGPFAMTMHGHYWAFYLMAENLAAESCVLEHPEMEDFERELRKGYDVLGLQVNWNTLGVTAEMLARAKRIAPGTRRVVGGYAIPQVLDPLPADREAAARIRDAADHLCMQEGVRYMRRLLGDRPLERPITQRTLPKAGSYLAAVGPRVVAQRSHPILVALGCPAGCDFCNTSAFFRRRKIRVADPAEVHECMRHHLLADGGESAFFELFDEDLFLSPSYSRDLGRLLRADPGTAGRVGYFAFGSVRSLSRFDPEELAANGLSTVWIGVESTLEEASGIGGSVAKREGKDVARLFEELQDVGIKVMGSLILGFDFHTSENVRRDIDAFVALDPTVSQVTPLVPCAGTELYERMKAANRLPEEFGWTVPGGFRRHAPLEPLHLSWAELQARIAEANERLYTEKGPSVLRTLSVALRGHRRLREHSDPVLRARARALGEEARRQYPLLEAVLGNAPSERVRDRARGLREHWREAFGPPEEALVEQGRRLAEHIAAFARRPVACPEAASPATRWTRYRPGAAPEVTKQAA